MNKITAYLRFHLKPRKYKSIFCQFGINPFIATKGIAFGKHKVKHIECMKKPQFLSNIDYKLILQDFEHYTIFTHKFLGYFQNYKVAVDKKFNLTFLCYELKSWTKNNNMRKYRPVQRITLYFFTWYVVKRLSQSYIWFYLVVLNH